MFVRILNFFLIYNCKDIREGDFLVLHPGAIDHATMPWHTGTLPTDY